VPELRNGFAEHILNSFALHGFGLKIEDKNVKPDKGGNRDMGERYPEHLYSERDLEKAYTSGLESAVVVLEKSIGLNQLEQIIMLRCLKKMIIDRKVRATMSSP
jgi:hypothetical protein